MAVPPDRYHPTVEPRQGSNEGSRPVQPSAPRHTLSYVTAGRKESPLPVQPVALPQDLS